MYGKTTLSSQPGRLSGAIYRRGWPLAIIALLVGLLAGCQPAATPAPLPSPIVLEAQASETLLDSQNKLYECARQQDLALILQNGSGGLVLRWGAQPGWAGYAAVLGDDDLVLAANPANPLQSLSVETVRSIFSGGLREWSDAGWDQADQTEIRAWGYPADSDIRQAAETTVLAQAMPDGKLFLAPGPAELRESLAQDPAALGFLPRRWLNDQLKAITIEGIDPARLRLPVLALSPTQPDGPAAQWLLCLQEEAF